MVNRMVASETDLKLCKKTRKILWNDVIVGSGGSKNTDFSRELVLLNFHERTMTTFLNFKPVFFFLNS